MIFIGTVHWKDARWVEIQHRMLKEHIQAPHKIFGYLNDVDQSYYSFFDVVLDGSEPMHEDKLDASCCL